jgi:hypothetical protein
MRRIVGNQGHVMDKSYSGNQQISIFNQLPARSQLGIEFSSLVQDCVIDHDNAQRPPQALEEGELPMYPSGQKPAPGLMIVGQDWCSIASRLLNKYEPLHL